MDGVIWMENGKAVTGTHEELLKTVPEYENLYTSQVHAPQRTEVPNMARKKQVRTVIFDTVKKQKGLSLGIVSAVIGAVVFALIPPLILADIVDSITAGTDAAFARILLHFAMLALTGFTESARESSARGIRPENHPTRYAAA